jgi:cytochrome c-type biogenesis protein
LDAGLLAFDFVLGAAAFFSPCGFPMLPAYVAYYLPREGSGRPLLRGLAGGLLAALGAFLVIASIGALAVALGAPFKARVVHLELAGGLAVGTLGVLVLLGRGPSARVSLRPSTRRGAAGLLSFGALYAAVAASCVAPVFVGVLFQALASPTRLDAALAVLAYAAGLGALLVAVTALVATAQGRALAVLRRIVPHAERAGGVVLVLVGAYLVYYWARAAFA